MAGEKQYSIKEINGQKADEQGKITLPLGGDAFANTILLESYNFETVNKQAVLDYINSIGLVIPEEANGATVIKIVDFLYHNYFKYLTPEDLPETVEFKKYIGNPMGGTIIEADLGDVTLTPDSIGFGVINYNYLGAVDNGNLNFNKIVELYTTALAVSNNGITEYTELKKIILNSATTVTANGINNNPKLESISAPELLVVSGNGIRTNPVLKVLHAPKLTTCTQGGIAQNPELQSLIIPNVTTLTEGGISGNLALKKLIMNSVTNVSSGQISNLNSLEHVEINSMLSNNSGSTGWQIINLDNSQTLKVFKANAFEILSNIDNEDFPNLEVLELNSCKIISAGVKIDNTKLVTLTLPSLETLENDGRISYNSLLTELNLPNLIHLRYSNTTISYNPKLTTLSLPNVTTMIYGGCISFNNLLSTVELPNLVTINSGGGVFNNPNLNSLILTNLENLTDSANFRNNTGLEELILPKVLVFNGDPWENSSSVTNIVLGANVSIRNISAFCFPALEELHAVNAVKVEFGGICNLPNITNIQIPNVTEITNGAIINNPELLTLNCVGLITMGGSGITGCPKLVNATFPNVVTMTNIGGTAIEDFDMPNLTTISGGGFANSSAVTRFYLPNLTTYTNGIFGGIIGQTIDVTVPTAMDGSIPLMELQANNIVNLTLV